MFGALDDEAFVFAIRQGWIGLRMAAIECNEERPFRIALAPYVMIFASVLVLVVGSSGIEVFVFVQDFQFIFQKLVNDTPDLFRFIAQDVCNATSPTARPKRKGKPM